MISKKLKKLKRNPKQFILDSKAFKYFSDKQKEPRQKEPRQKEPRQKEPRQKEPRQKEPLLFSETSYKDNIYKIDVFKKTVINQTLGFSNLIVTDKDSDYLINKPYVSLFLKDKSFIAFRDKSMYFLRDDIRLKKVIFKPRTINKLFLNNQILRQNNFSVFRNVITINMLSPTSILIKNSNPFIRLICIIDNTESLEYIKNYLSNIDVLIIKDQRKELNNIKFTKKIDSSFFNNKLKVFDINKWIFYIPKTIYQGHIPRIIKFKNDLELLNVTKTILIDNSYKTDSNILLPIISTSSNLKDIDLYNKNKVQGLIRFNYKKIDNIENFNMLVDNFSIEELYLAENLYSLYKDMIVSINNKEDLRALLKKTLYDGVFYEEI